MSTTAKTVFALCCTVSGGIVAYVHYKQEYDREQLHLGVIRDIERQQRRKAENLHMLNQQRELTKKLREQENSERELVNAN